MSETGAYVARRGFVYQDHVAVSLLLDLVTAEELAAVWCEALDDITLIRRRGEGEEVEFVQVKASELAQLWSVALVCVKDQGASHCLVEKSLAHDCCAERVSFRIVTRWEVMKELQVLKLPIGSPMRLEEHRKALVESLGERLSHVRSAKGNDLGYWVDQTLWDVRGHLDAVVNTNLIRLNRIAHDLGAWLAPDQLQEVYEGLLRLAQTAAEAGPNDIARKKISKSVALLELTRSLERHALGSSSRPGLDQKLKEAGFSETAIRAAFDLRRHYRQEVLTPRYFTAESRERFEFEVQGLLHGLRVDFDAGVTNDSPQQFLARCIAALRNFQAGIGVGAPSLAMLEGAMYDLTHRCLHRFNQAVA